MAANHPLDHAVAREQDQYVHEIEGAPWWMPINQDIAFQPGAPANGSEEVEVLVGPGHDEDINEMDAVQVVVGNNPWMQRQAENREKQRLYLLSLDYQVNCRKFLLFTSLLFVIVVLTYASSVYTGFYQLKGWTFNGIVAGIMTYGLIVGFVANDLNRHRTRTVLALLNLYWLIAWLTLIGLFCTACVYLVLFPSKFQGFCSEHGCDASTGIIIFAECSLVSSLLLYILLALFYMQRVAVLHLLCCNLRSYNLKNENNLFMRLCHRHNYRFIRGWKRLRRVLSSRTGLHLSDLLYCSCCFRSCKRQSSREWRPVSINQSAQPINFGQPVPHYFAHDEDEQSPAQGQGLKAEEKEEEAENPNQPRQHWQEPHREECFCYCDNISSDPACCSFCDVCCRDCDIAWLGCMQCLRQCFGAMPCCRVYHSDHVGECADCCRGCGEVCSFCGDCGDCDCSNCGGGWGDCSGCDCGEGAAALCGGILVGIACVILFLLPIVVFVLIAAPFWLLAQWLCWKLNDKVPWLVVILIFIIFMVPPCILWALLWTFICYGNNTGTFMKVMCMIWSFFHSIYSSLSM